MNKRFYYIVGYGRSGSTIIEKYISEKLKYLGCGELEYLYERYIINNEPCSCSLNHGVCKVWEPIKKELNNIFLTDKSLTKEYFKQKRNNEGFRSFIREIKDNNLYEEIESKIIDNAFLYNNNIIDSSKSPGRLRAIFKMSIKAKIIPILIYRNPCAVAYSWKQEKNEIPGKKKTFKKFNIINSAIYWSIYNIFSLYVIFISKKLRDVVIISYEEFIENPNKLITNLSKNNNISHNYKEYLHQIAGNPSRFNKTIKLKRDDRWIEGLTFSHKLVVYTLTTPTIILIKIAKKINQLIQDV